MKNRIAGIRLVSPRQQRDKLETNAAYWLKFAADSKNYISFKSFRILSERAYKQIVTCVI